MTARGPGRDGPSPTLSECIDAGLFYFSREQYAEARHWWEHALLLEPDNARARECLRYLARVTSVSGPGPALTPDLLSSGQGGVTPDLIPGPQPATPDLIPEGWSPAPPVADEDDFDIEETDVPLPSLPPRAESAPPAQTPPPVVPIGAADPWGEPDSEQTLDPWSEGPDVTSVVTLDGSSGWEDDPVADNTPYPISDREPLFGPPMHLLETAERRRDRIATSPVLGARRSSNIQRVEEQKIPPDRIIQRARERLQFDDFDGTLELLEAIPPESPSIDEARQMLKEARDRLEQQYASQLGGFEQIPRVLLSGEELIWLNMNHRAGFILSLIDGRVCYEDLIALSGMPRLDTLRILCTLASEGVIETIVHS